MPYSIVFKNKDKLGGTECRRVNTLSAAIQQAVLLSKLTPRVRHEIYFQDTPKAELELMMVVRDGMNIASR